LGETAASFGYDLAGLGASLREKFVLSAKLRVPLVTFIDDPLIGSLLDQRARKRSHPWKQRHNIPSLRESAFFPSPASVGSRHSLRLAVPGPGNVGRHSPRRHRKKAPDVIKECRDPDARRRREEGRLFAAKEIL